MKAIFPGSDTRPTQVGDILDLSHDPIWAIWLAEVRKFHQHHDRIVYWRISASLGFNELCEPYGLIETELLEQNVVSFDSIFWKCPLQNWRKFEKVVYSQQWRDMSVLVSYITGNTIVCQAVCSG